MLRLIAFLLATVGVGTGLAWLADRPGNITISWQGTLIDVSVFTATWVSVLAIFVLFVAWSIFRAIWRSPAAVGQYFKKRRQARGLDALSSGMIAIGSGDRESATRYAIQARKDLPNEPLTHLLRAQAAQLTNDHATSRRIYEGMLGSRDTEALGLRGLFLEAQSEGESEAARQFAQRALTLNTKLGWASNALFDMQCKAKDWPAALDTLASARKNGLIGKTAADRRRAILLTAQAQIAEDDDPDKALKLAIEAHGLAPKLVPAGDIAGRLLASRGNTAKAAKVLQNTWKRAPHPDLALTYAYARPGDSPRDRLTRVRTLTRMTPHTIESPIALATTAIEARDWTVARKALEPLLDKRITQRVCTLMAQIEAEEHGDAGRVREWLARAVNAPRDPTWTADGVTSAQWAPVSPVTGELDAFEWRVPVESVDQLDGAILTQRLEEFVALGAADNTMIGATTNVIKDVTDGAPAHSAAPVTAATGRTAATATKQAETASRKTAAPTPTAKSGAAATSASTARTNTPGAAKPRPAAPSAAPPPPPAQEPIDVTPAKTGMPETTRAATSTAQPDMAASSAASDAAAKSGISDQAAKTTRQPIVIDVEPAAAATKKPDNKDAARTDRAPPAAGPSAQMPMSRSKSRKPTGSRSETKVKAKAKAKHAPKPAAAKPATDEAAAAGGKSGEAKIFVPPRAPDDPGPDRTDVENQQRMPLSSFRSGQIKGSA